MLKLQERGFTAVAYNKVVDMFNSHGGIGPRGFKLAHFDVVRRLLRKTRDAVGFRGAWKKPVSVTIGSVTRSAVVHVLGLREAIVEKLLETSLGNQHTVFHHGGAAACAARPGAPEVAGTATAPATVRGAALALSAFEQKHAVHLAELRAACAASGERLDLDPWPLSLFNDAKVTGKSNISSVDAVIARHEVYHDPDVANSLASLSFLGALQKPPKHVPGRTRPWDEDLALGSLYHAQLGVAYFQQIDDLFDYPILVRNAAGRPGAVVIPVPFDVGALGDRAAQCKLCSMKSNACFDCWAGGPLCSAQHIAKQYPQRDWASIEVSYTVRDEAIARGDMVLAKKLTDKLYGSGHRAPTPRSFFYRRADLLHPRSSIHLRLCILHIFALGMWKDLIRWLRIAILESWATKREGYDALALHVKRLQELLAFSDGWTTRRAFSAEGGWDAFTIAAGRDVNDFIAICAYALDERVIGPEGNVTLVALRRILERAASIANRLRPSSHSRAELAILDADIKSYLVDASALFTGEKYHAKVSETDERANSSKAHDAARTCAVSQTELGNPKSGDASSCERFLQLVQAAWDCTSGHGDVLDQMCGVLADRAFVKLVGPVLLGRPAPLDAAATSPETYLAQLTWGATTASPAAASAAISSAPLFIAREASNASFLCAAPGVAPADFADALLRHAERTPSASVFPVIRPVPWAGYLHDPHPFAAPNRRPYEFLAQLPIGDAVRAHLARQLAGFIPGTVADVALREARALASLSSTDAGPGSPACFVSRSAFISSGPHAHHDIAVGSIVTLDAAHVAAGVGGGAAGAGAGAGAQHDAAPASTARVGLVQALFACRATRPAGLQFIDDVHVSFVVIHLYEGCSPALAATLRGYDVARPRTLGLALGGAGAPGPALDVIRLSSINGIVRYRPLCNNGVDVNLYKPEDLGGYVPCGPTSFTFHPDP